MTTASFSMATDSHGPSPAIADAVELVARVVPDGDHYLAAVDGLELEGKGATPDAAQEALVQTMRGWLERLDTTGKLGLALGVDGLDEETEIVLEFVSPPPEHQEPST